MEVCEALFLETFKKEKHGAPLGTCVKVLK